MRSGNFVCKRAVGTSWWSRTRNSMPAARTPSPRSTPPSRTRARHDPTKRRASIGALTGPLSTHRVVLHEGGEGGAVGRGGSGEVDGVSRRGGAHVAGGGADGAGGDVGGSCDGDHVGNGTRRDAHDHARRRLAEGGFARQERRRARRAREIHV